jgi:Lysyl oxidase
MLVALVVLATLAAAVTLMATANGYTGGQLMLPDLRQAPVGCRVGYVGDSSRCADWDVCLARDDQDLSPTASQCVDSGPIKAVRLRFTTSVENVGDGPALLYGHRDSTDQITMSVRQALQVGEHGPIPDSYATAQRGVDEAIYYDTVHEHWNLLSFAHMELKTLSGETVANDRKNGFCLGDRYTTTDAGSLVHNVRQDGSPEGKLAERLGNNQCNYRGSLADEVKEGISVGRGDNYPYNVALQWLDITHVPSGTYVVVNTVNSGHTLLETNYDNNSSSIVISLQWPAGAHDPPTVITAPPAVKLLNSCPGRAQCSAN